MENENKELQEDLTIKEKRELKRQEKLARRAANPEQKNRFFLWIFVLIVLVAAVIALSKLANTKDVTPVASTVLESITSTDFIRGNATASTTITEYADFECPACASYHPVLVQLEKEFGSKVRFVYRFFPLQQHPNARTSARAALAAAKQGKFWEMHDKLFESQSEWAAKPDAEAKFLSYATALGLNIVQYKRDFSSKEIGNTIDTSYRSGIKYGVSSTPTFFINNTKYSFSSFNELKQTIEDAIAGKIK
jgi:protein-disulfide isomerase